MRNELLPKEIQEEIIFAAMNKRIRKAQKRLEMQRVNNEGEDKE